MKAHQNILFTRVKELENAGILTKVNSISTSIIGVISEKKIENNILMGSDINVEIKVN